MGMRKQYRIQFGKRLKRNSGLAYSREKLSKGSIEIRIGEQALPTNLN
jgi:hypothetical protein